MPKNLSNNRTWIALGLILLVAAALRFYGIGWGIPRENQPRSYHPDEKMAPLVLSRMRPAEGEFNPKYFINPSLFYYQYGLLLAPICRLTETTPPWQVKDYIAFTQHPPQEQKIWFLTGRALSVLMGVVTVWGVFWIGVLLAGRPVGLTAAAILTVMPAHVIQSHYMVVDGPAVMWMVLSLGFFILGLQRRRALPFALSGLILGFGAATKYTAVVAVLPQVVLAFQAALESGRAGSKKSKSARGSAGLFGAVRAFTLWCSAHWRWLLLWVVLGAVGFLLGCPYAILDWNTFMGPGGIGGLRNYNVFGFSPYTVFRVCFFYGLGPLMALFVLAALLVVISRPAKRMFSLGVYLLANLLILILNASPYMRHFVPLTPFLALCAGYLVLEIYHNLLPRIPPSARRTVLAVGLLVFGYTTVITLSLLQAMDRKDSRTAAAQWLQENAEKYWVVAVIRPEWGEDFYSVPVDKITLSHVVTGFEYRLVEVFKPDFLIITEYDLNDYLKNPVHKDFKARLESSLDYAPVAAFKRRESFFDLPIWYNPPGADWLYFCPNVTIYGRSSWADSSRMFYLEGRNANGKDDFLQAEDAFAKATQLDKDNPLYLSWLSFNRAMIFNRVAKEGNTQGAMEILEKSQEALEWALNIHPRAWMRIELTGLLARMKFQEGLGRIGLGQFEMAQEVLVEARSVKNQQKVIEDSLSNVSLSTWDKEYNETLMVLGDSYLRASEWQEAERVLTELLKRDSTHRKALIGLGNVYLQNPESHSRALKIFRRALSLYPDLRQNGNITRIVERLERELSDPIPP